MIIQYLLSKIKFLHKDNNGDIVQRAIIIGIFAMITVAVLSPLRAPLELTFSNIIDAIMEAASPQ
jgi:hypothetical protein